MRCQGNGTMKIGARAIVTLGGSLLQNGRQVVSRIHQMAMRTARAAGMSRAPSLVILDDVFPHILTGFRIPEYNAIFQAIPDAEVHSMASYPWPGVAEGFEQLHQP